MNSENMPKIYTDIAKIILAGLELVMGHTITRNGTFLVLLLMRKNFDRVLKGQNCRIT